jgi:carbon starvation protein
MKSGGQSIGLTLWQLFGTTNQLIAALGLFIVTLFLIKEHRNYKVTLFPTLFMFIVVFAGLIIQIFSFIRSDQKIWSLLLVSIIILFLTIWLLVQAIVSFRNNER